MYSDFAEDSAEYVDTPPAEVDDLSDMLGGGMEFEATQIVSPSPDGENLYGAPVAETMAEPDEEPFEEEPAETEEEAADTDFEEEHDEAEMVLELGI